VTPDDCDEELALRDEKALREYDLLEAIRRPRLQRAKTAYKQAITGIWAGNGGAALAMIGLIEAAWTDGSFLK
jgi:hypothetical protein